MHVEAIERLRAETEAIWLSMPDDVRALRGRRGTKGYAWPVLICAEENTRAFADAMSILRNLVADDGVEIESLKRVAEAFVQANLAVLRNWYGLEACAAVVDSAMPALAACQTRDELAGLFHELVAYTGRLHWWADTLVPWDDVSRLYETTFNSKLDEPSR